jgi:hypothetical protein
MKNKKGYNFDADSAKDYEVYAEEAREREEPELAEFFEDLAIVFQQQSLANIKPKLTLREKIRTWKDVIEGE